MENKPTEYGDMKEDRLIDLAREGDDQAMECLIKRYVPLVRGISRAYFLLGADREDVIQEGMIGLFKAVRDFSPGSASRFRSFAELCVTRQILTAVKAASRQKHLAMNSYISLSSMISEEDDRSMDDIIGHGLENPETLLLAKEQGKEWRKEILEQLSDLELQVLFRYLKGMDYHVISMEMGRDLKSVDNALQRIRKKIQMILLEKT